MDKKTEISLAVYCRRCKLNGHMPTHCPNVSYCEICGKHHGFDDCDVMVEPTIEVHPALLVKECVRCCETTIDCTFNCGHRCMCYVCASWVDKCPMCGTCITQRIKTFL